MKRKLRTLIAAASAALLCACSTQIGENLSTNGRDYYLDAEKGADTNDGSTPDKAWKSLAKVSGTTFSAGDRIFFKNGSVFNGSVRFSGKGTAEEPILVSRYGKGEERPHIKGNGALTAVLVENSEYMEINGLEISNTGKERLAKRRGLTLRVAENAALHRLQVKDLVIRDVNGSLVKKQGGGGAICVEQEDYPEARFIDLLIEDCHILRCERNAINFRGNSNRSSWHPNKNVVIRGNLIEKVPGDCIVPIACDSTIIEKNVVRLEGTVGMEAESEAAAGIWPWSCDNTIIRYNEVSGHNAKWDGQGFDADFNCTKTLFENNYSHDNQGGFILVCCKGSTAGTPGNIGTLDVTIRDNVSFNDGLREFQTRKKWISPSFHITGPTRNVEICGNIIIMPSKRIPEVDDSVFEFGNWDGPWPENVNIHDNAFYLAGKFKMKQGEARNVQLVNNKVEENLPDSKLTERLGGELLQKILKEVEYVKKRR